MKCEIFSGQRADFVANFKQLVLRAPKELCVQIFVGKRSRKVF